MQKNRWKIFTALVIEKDESMNVYNIDPHLDCDHQLGDENPNGPGRSHRLTSNIRELCKFIPKL